MAAGIVRRIDELGRIVIPKEMRRTMRLKEGDEMEIAASGDSITLRKYSGFESVLAAAKAVGKLLAESLDADVLFVSPEGVAVAEGKNRKKYAGAALTDAFQSAVRARKGAILHGEQLKDLLDGREIECAYLVLEPVVVNGDLVGAAALLLSTLPSDIARAYLHFCAELIEAALA